MCILSGCDYLANLPGIGLGKAKKLLKSIQKSDIDKVSLLKVAITKSLLNIFCTKKILRQMPKALKMPSLVITEQYVENFKRADKTFKYQITFDPLKRKLASLHPYSAEIVQIEDLSYAGR